jgi:uncharacterized membrane protein YjjP (DUF1212 family)
MSIMHHVIYAVCTLVFHIVLSVAMLAVGDWPVQACALVALFTAGLSQFFIQEDTPRFAIAAVVSAYASILSLFMGILMFVFPI